MALDSPKHLVFTLFGDFFLEREDALPVAGIIRLLEPLGVTATNVRTVLSRMTQQGWMEADGSAGRGYYRLSARGVRMLRDGARRIHDPPVGEPWDGAWTLLSYSVPEEHRAQRDRLRERVSWLGFGSLGNGLWVSPRDLRSEVARIAEELDVKEHLELFRSRHVGFSEPAALVARCWDLEDLNRRYDAFIEGHLPACARLREGDVDVIRPHNAYVRRFRLVHEYRVFPLADPYLPRPLQPPRWAGECALVLFRVYHELLRRPAERFVREVLGEASPGSASGHALSREVDARACEPVVES